MTTAVVTVNECSRTIDRLSKFYIYIVALLFVQITVTDGRVGEIYRDPLIKSDIIDTHWHIAFSFSYFLDYISHLINML